MDGGAVPTTPTSEEAMNMRTVRAVSSQLLEDVQVLVTVLAEHEDGSGARLEIQRALSFDRRDVDAGMNTYCVSTEKGGYSLRGHRGCHDWEWHAHSELELGSRESSRIALSASVES
jgi:hypothetical protein